MTLITAVRGTASPTMTALTMFSNTGTRTLVLMLSLLQPANALRASLAAMPRPTQTRAGTVVAIDARREPVNVARDALMQRTVEQQLKSFTHVGRVSEKNYLTQQW